MFTTYVLQAYYVSVNPGSSERERNTRIAVTASKERTPATLREPLTRARVVQAALRVMDEEGLQAVTMRRIGRELGVEAMSLYNHVRDKEDLLQGVIEAVLAEFRFEPTADDWLTQAKAAAGEWRRLLRSHPNVVHVMLENKHPLMSPEALRPMEIAFELLRRAGLSDRDAVSAFQAIGAFIFGHVMMEVGNVAPGPTELDGRSAEELRRTLGPAFPHFAELLPAFLECDMDATFDLGLEALLTGVRSVGRERDPASA
jgi:AcrR family transcriptional regulator